MRALCFLGVLVLAGCKTPEPEAPPIPPPPVHVAVVARTELVPTTEGVATLEAARDATLRAEVPGRVLALLVERGQRVSAGAALARLDVGRTEVALGAASAQIAQAEAAVAQAERQRELTERLVERGGAATSRLDDARDGERLARAALDAARAQQRVTRRGLTEAVLRAPFDGVVADRFVEVGELASPGAPMLRLVDTSSLRATVLLDPREALDLRPGARAQVEAHARAGERFGASVERVGEVVDPRTRRLPVEVRVTDPERRLRPGLSARVVVETGEAEPAIVLPSAAIFERYGQSFVYVIDAEDVARRRPVRPGRARAGQMPIDEGVEVGERVVVAGLERVVPDRPVRVVPREADGSPAASRGAERDEQAGRGAESGDATERGGG